MLDLNKSEAELEAESKAADIAGRRSIRLTRLVVGVLVLLALGGFIATVIVSHQNAEREAALENASRERMDTNPARAVAYLKDEYSQRVWKNGKKTYVLSYTFEANSKTYEGTCEVVSLPTQMTEYVYYDPENPSMNKLRKEAAREGQIEGVDVREGASWSSAVAKSIYWMVIAMALGFYRRWTGKK